MASPYDFNVDFSPLATLPQLARGAEQDRQTQEALKNLDTSSYQSLSDAAARVLRLGGDPKIAIQLYNAASTRYAAEQRAAADIQYARNLPSIYGRGLPTAPAPELPGPSDFGPPPTAGSAPGAPAPTPGAPFPPPIPPGAPPVGFGRQSQAEPSPQSPSDAIIAKAQTGMDSSTTPARRTTLAGPYPTPDTASPGMQTGGQMVPPVALPAWSQGITPSGPLPQGLAPVPTPEGAAPPTAESSLPSPVNVPSFGGNLDAARTEIERRMMMIPPKYGSSPAARALMTQYTNIADQMKMPKDMQEYRIQLIQDMRSGEPYYTYSEYKIMPKIAEEQSKAVLNAAYGKGGYREKMMNAENQRNALDTMDSIMANPDFRSGAGVSYVAKGLSALTALSKTAQEMGLPVPDIEQIRSLQGPIRSARLAEAFLALSNQVGYAQLGTLGNQISNADRDYIAAMFPNLSTSVEGNKLLSKIMRTVLDKAIAGGRASEEYLADRPLTRARLPSMDRYVRSKVGEEPAFVNADGSLTETGKKFRDDYARVIATPDVSTPARNERGLIYDPSSNTIGISRPAVVPSPRILPVQ